MNLMQSSSTTQLESLRAKYPAFEYRSATYDLSTAGLALKYDFFLSPTEPLHTEYLIEGVTQAQLDRLSPAALQWHVFHLGLFALLGYWKLSCSPVIKIEAGFLSEEQIKWWHKLLIKGMGEFFYVNQIDFTAPDFVKFENGSQPTQSDIYQNTQQYIETHSNKTILIPIGGGKDSVVSIELLKNIPGMKALGFMLEPETAYLDCFNASRLENQITVRRHLDPHLAELEKSGFLKGHIPFSAGLAFLTTFVAQLFGYDYIALSNERSANEGNVYFHDHEINHQYSKTYEFERDFQNYVADHLKPLTGQTPHYFSFLRPLYELQIARLFAQFTPYHSLFISCNRGMRSHKWCGECPKCLFAYLILSPFMAPDQVAAIFGQNLLDKPELLPLAEELMGFAEVKPLECVGTREESLIAAHLAVLKYQEHHLPLPRLLEMMYQKYLLQEQNLNQRTSALLNSWNAEHSLPAELETVLRQAVSNSTQ